VSIPDVPLGPITPRCATHPEEAASGTCARCGTFFCGQCVQLIFDKVWCATCAARPEINYLERFRLKLWGRRDTWAWLIGVGSIILGVVTIMALVSRVEPLVVGILAAHAVTGVGFFLGVRWARHALIGTPLLCSVVAGLSAGPNAGFLMFILFLCALTVYFDARNQLFFRREISPERLRRLWHLHENNPLARTALSCATGGVLFPVFAPFAIVFGVLALRRVDPEAIPPIGRKGQAITAIVLGAAVVLLWALVLVPVVSRRLSFFFAD
jgi:hypothetical protein